MLTHTKFQNVDTITIRYVQRRTPDLRRTCRQEQLTEITLINCIKGDEKQDEEKLE